MTEAPEKIWFTKVGKNIIPNSQRMSPEDVEYLRKDKHIAYLADYRAAYEESCQQIDSYKAEVARLRSALQSMVYETTHLSPLQDDGSHWCKISHGALAEARAALSDVSS